MTFLRRGAAAFGGVFLAALLGAAAALIAIAFFDGAGHIQQFFGLSDGGGWMLALLPPMAAVICAWLKAQMGGGRFLGLADTMLAAAQGGAQQWRTSLMSAAASFVAFSGGLSVGQYGPVGHLGGFVGGWFRRWWPPGVGAACGVAAAIAAAFNAPVTGLVFAGEVILRRSSARAFAPVAVSAVAGYLVSAAVFERPPFLPIGEMRAAIPSDVALFAAQGALFGWLSGWYLRAMFALSRKVAPIPTLPLFLAAGAVCGGLWWVLPSASGGRELLLAATAGDFAGGWREALTIAAVKAAATIVCLGVGLAGGVVGPTLAIGAVGGVAYAAAAGAAGLYSGPVFAPAVCGMMAFTAPVIGAPLAGILFVLELSGGNYPLTLSAILAVALSSLAAGTSGRGSYYEMQLRARGDSLPSRQED